MVPLVISSAPLTIVPFAGMLVGAPILWAGIAVLAGAPRTRRNTLAFAGVMLSHYLAAVVLAGWTPAGDWDRTYEVIPGFLDGWVVAYAAANVLAWGLFLTPRPVASGVRAPEAEIVSP